MPHLLELYRMAMLPLAQYGEVQALSAACKKGLNSTPADIFYVSDEIQAVVDGDEKGVWCGGGGHIGRNSLPVHAMSTSFKIN
jgi:hypothetical protein